MCGKVNDVAFNYNPTVVNQCLINLVSLYTPVWLHMDTSMLHEITGAVRYIVRTSDEAYRTQESFSNVDTSSRVEKYIIHVLL